SGMTNSSVGFPQFYQIQQILDRFLEKKLVQYNHDLQILKTSLARQKDTANLQVGKQKRATEQRMTQTETNIQDKKQDISDTQSAIKVAQNNLQSYEKRYQHYAHH
ncbi:hypothetical protein QUD76_13770, partial [Lacticaseibacillus paracasei]|nr:hypothetical protein [Lacticaseibacillus paracasei]